MEEEPSQGITKFISEQSIQNVIHDVILICEDRIRNGDKTVWRQISDYFQMRTGVPIYDLNSVIALEYNYTTKTLNSGSANDFEMKTARRVNSILESSMDQWKKLEKKEENDEIIIVPKKVKLHFNPTRILPSRRAKNKSHLTNPENLESSSHPKNENEKGIIISENSKEQEKFNQAHTSPEKIKTTSKLKERTSSNYDIRKPEISSSLLSTDSTNVSNSEFLKDDNKPQKSTDSESQEKNAKNIVNTGKKKRQTRTKTTCYVPIHGNNSDSSNKKMRYEDTISLPSVIDNERREGNGDFSKTQDLSKFSNSSNGSTVPPTTDKSKDQQIMTPSMSVFPPQNNVRALMTVVNRTLQSNVKELCLFQNYINYQSNQNWANNSISSKSSNFKREYYKIQSYKTMFHNLLSLEEKRLETLEKKC